MANLIKIITKPDNVAILVMMVLVAFFTYYAFSLARKNDKKSSEVKEDENKTDKEKIHTWPFLVRKEFLIALLVIIVLLLWSVYLDAPLEEHANPNLTPNPAKAPWYFLGLQELLVYFDPWIAGVMIPLFIIIGLMLIPYLDVNLKGNGYYSFSERKFEILVFFFGFHFLWILLIVIGVFMRGPGWLWFWPWEEWDTAKVVAGINIDFSQIFGISSRSVPGFLIGGSLVFIYYFLGMFLPYRYLKRAKPGLIKKLGFIRYSITAFLFWSMIGVPIKIILRLGWNIKYLWVTPWFNI